MNIWIILLIVLVVLAFAGSPGVSSSFGWNHSYGYYPSGIVTLVVVVLLILLITGRL
jgi:hypothetical protein